MCASGIVFIFGWFYLLHFLHFRNIEDLTNQVNNLEIKVNDSELENEELRERLGMDPKEKLDIEDVRTKKKVKAEQAVALNRALTKEVLNRYKYGPLSVSLDNCMRMLIFHPAWDASPYLVVTPLPQHLTQLSSFCWNLDTTRGGFVMDKCLAIFVVPQSLHDKRRKTFCLQVFFLFGLRPSLSSYK